MNCRGATMLLRDGLLARGSGRVASETLDAAASHIASCLLCQQELLDAISQGTGSASAVVRQLEGLINECRDTQRKLAAYTTAVRAGEGASTLFPGVWAHLDACPSCSLDYHAMADLARPWSETAGARTTTLVGGLRVAVDLLGARFRDVAPALVGNIALVGRRMGAGDSRAGEQLTVQPPGSNVVITIRIDPAPAHLLRVNVTVGPESLRDVEIGLSTILEGGGRGSRSVEPGHSVARELGAGSYELRVSAESEGVTDVIIPFEVLPKEGP